MSPDLASLSAVDMSAVDMSAEKMTKLEEVWRVGRRVGSW